ncbi:MAG: hypothetical protein IJR45_08575, partial [Firmicutes bacterium]|nr:hypothetical protein [Bacillota bacterium]
MKKRRKKVKRFETDKLKFSAEERELIFDFILRYKNGELPPPKSYHQKKKKARVFFDSVPQSAAEQLKLFEKPFTTGGVVNAKKLYYKYWNMRKFYPDLTAGENTEKQLDKMMGYVADFEAAKLYKEKEKLKNPACVDVEMFFKQPGAYANFFNTDVNAVVNLREYAYSLDVIDSALNRRFDIESRRQTKRRMFYIHVGKTNSGKTYNSIQMMKNAEKGAYLSPLRLLALEISDNLNNEGIPCSFVTGEEERVVENASHIASTVELADFNTEYDVVVIDECQMIADNSRGYAWTRAIMGVTAREICLCTAPEALDVLIKLIDACGDFYEVINHRRKPPLQIEETPFKLSDVQPGDALVVFSKQKVNAIGAQLIKMGIDVSVLYGALPYETRKQQFENFVNGKSSVL